MFNDVENVQQTSELQKKKVAEKGYKSGLLDKHISTVEKLDENEMLQEKLGRNREKHVFHFH